MCLSSWYTKKVKGGTLAYVTGLSLLIFMLLLIPFLVDHYAYREINQLNKRLNLNEKFYSTVRLFELGECDIEYEKTYELTVFKNQATITCFIEKWGIFDLIQLYSNESEGFRDTLVLFAAERFLKNDSICLYLADKGNYLSLTGDTHVEGKCYLPELGVTKAYVEGLSYTKDTLIYGTMDISSDTLPPLKEELLSRFNVISNSLDLFGDKLLPDSLINDFVWPSIHFHYSGNVVLTSSYLEGKIIISSGGEIRVPGDITLDGCILMAPRVVIEEGFKGRVQIFANKEIEISDNSKLLYPSVAFVNNTKEEDASIKLGDGVFFCGIILLNRENDSREVALTIGEKSIVEGMVYNTGVTDLKGDVWGEIYTGRFKLERGFSSYEDILMNTIINKTLVSTHFVGINLFENTNTRPGIKCIVK